jgi:peroxiredoxin
MNPIKTFPLHATNHILLSATVALVITLTQLSARAERLDDFKKLEAEFAAATQEFVDTRRKENPTDADLIRNYEEWPYWQFLPRFIALAEANPADDTAYQCCLWAIDRPARSSERAAFAADQKAWQIIAAHHATGDNVPKLCLEAARSVGPAREEFLRGLLKQANHSEQHAGFATLALAELLAKKFDRAQHWQHRRRPPAYEVLSNYLQDRVDPRFIRYVSEADIDATKNESAELFRVVLDRYANVPVISARGIRGFRQIATLGDKARISLHALEHLHVGAEAPDIVGQDFDGNPLKLKDYRGRVVVLSFWYTACGPCIAMIPEERNLVEKFKDRPFALLAISRDPDIETSRKTAAEHNMTWPCWFDGHDRSIHRDYNIMGWPTFYLLDQDGRIVNKHLNGSYLERAVAELLDKSGGEDDSKNAALGK